MNKYELEFEKLTKVELIRKCAQYRVVLDRRPEARFSRWVENIGFAGGTLIIFLSILNVPFLDIDMFELTLAFILVATKLFGKTVGIDLAKSAFGSIGKFAEAVKNRKKNGN